MKKFVVLFLAALLPLALSACNRQDKVLYLLNWGEYINEDLFPVFEAETGITINLTTVDSNENMETELRTSSHPFDIMIPSDNMIEKLYDEGKLQKIDLTKLPHYAETNFMSGVRDIMADLFLDNADVTSAFEVCTPYFWGLFGLMYNTTLPGIAEYIETNGWGAAFGPLPAKPAGWANNPRVGIYSVPRFAYSAALIYATENDVAYPTIPDNAFNIYSEDNLQTARQILSARNYSSWATDQMKKDLDAGDLDIAFTYVGDYFDTYLLNAQAAEAVTGAQAEAANTHLGIYIPDKTIAFVDAMCIPADAKNVENAHLFIDFFLRPENAYANSDIVGYTTTLISVYNMIRGAEGGDVVRQTMVVNHPYNPMEITDRTIVGTPLIAFNSNQTSSIVQMIFDVKND